MLLNLLHSEWSKRRKIGNRSSKVFVVVVVVFYHDLGIIGEKFVMEGKTFNYLLAVTDMN